MTPEDVYDPTSAAADPDRFVVITGCSGGGKSTLLGELARRGFATFPEPGRQIVKEQLWTGGDALPWSDLAKFCELTASRALHFRIRAVAQPGPVFFDRSPIEQLCGLERLGLSVPPTIAGAVERCRYNTTVFVAPPWPEIFATDAERQHGMDEALAEYGPLRAAYERLGYRLVDLPKTAVRERADFVTAALETQKGRPSRTAPPER